MLVSTDPLASLRDFRDDLYACFGQRRDALFDLGDALLSGGPVLSSAHLSLEAVHRRGWGSLYAARCAPCSPATLWPPSRRSTRST